MASLNKVFIMGNLGRDPELRYTSNGKAAVNIGLATTEKYKKDGQAVEETEWHNVAAFDKLAEIIANYCKKGDTIHVTGKIKTKEYTDKNGDSKKMTQVIASDVVLVRTGNKDAASPAQKPAQKTPQAPKPTNTGFDGMDDDIPF